MHLQADYGGCTHWVDALVRGAHAGSVDCLRRNLASRQVCWSCALIVSHSFVLILPSIAYFSGSLRAHAIESYTSLLGKHASLWSVAITYLVANVQESFAHLGCCHEVHAVMLDKCDFLYISIAEQQGARVIRIANCFRLN